MTTVYVQKRDLISFYNTIVC